MGCKWYIQTKTSINWKSYLRMLDELLNIEPWPPTRIKGTSKELRELAEGEEIGKKMRMSLG